MKDNHIIRIGDTVYQDSKSYHKVFEWKILDIWFENYISGVKTIVKCSNGSWTEEFFASDIAYMHRSREDAERALKGGRKNEVSVLQRQKSIFEKNISC